MKDDLLAAALAPTAARELVKPEDYRGPSEFVHLHSHSIYSTLDGVALPSQYAEACVARKWPGMAITEHGHMGSLPDMYLEFKKHNIRVCSGCEIYFNDYEPIRKTLTTPIKQLKQDDPDLHLRIMRNRHLTVLAKNATGYSNLIKLTTQAHRTGMYYKPRIWYDKLLEYKEGLIILSGCLNGPMAHELRLEDGPRWTSKDKRGALDWVKKFKRDFGDDYKIELQMPGIERDDLVFRTLVDIADRTKTDLVLANDSHYLSRAEYQIQKIMMAVDQGLTVDDPNLFHVNSDEQYFKTRAELWARFKNNAYSYGLDDGVFERMCDNTLKVFDSCEPLKIDGSPKMPSFTNADERLTEAVAKSLVKRGLHKIQKRYLIDGREVTYAEQAKIELERIIDKGFASYFMITAELIAFGVARGWWFGPRGSGGGSLVVYLLGISPINPLPWGLSFNRFLSPSRGGYMLDVKMPQVKKVV